MKHNRVLICAMLGIALAAAVFAADITGTWTATFDTQVGQQKYTYTFKQTGTKLTGKAKSQSDVINADTEITEGSVNGDDVSFVENLDFQGMPLRIVYKGKVAGNEIKFTRTVLEMITEELVAKKAK